MESKKRPRSDDDEGDDEDEGKTKYIKPTPPIDLGDGQLLGTFEKVSKPWREEKYAPSLLVSGYEFLERVYHNEEISYIDEVRSKSNGKTYISKHPGTEGVEDMIKDIETLVKIGKHPNIVELVDYHINKENKSCFYIVEKGLVDLQYKIDEMMQRGLVHDYGEILKVIWDVASGLNHMHKMGIVHGDVKPMNIVKFENGFYKLIDFGTSRIMVKGGGGDKPEIGTATFLAPEVHVPATRSLIDEKVDIWALGVVFLAMLLDDGRINVSVEEIMLSYHKRDKRIPEDSEPNGYFNAYPDIIELIDMYIQRIDVMAYGVGEDYINIFLERLYKKRKKGITGPQGHTVMIDEIRATVGSDGLELLRKMFLPPKQRISAEDILKSPVFGEDYNPSK